MSYLQLQKPDNGVKSETHSDTLHGVLVDADFNDSIQPAELTDVYHPASEVYQTDRFDDLSDAFLPMFGTMESDPCQSGSDTVVGKVSDLSQKLSNLVVIKPLNYVPVQLQGHNQSYSCLSDSGRMIPIIKQSILDSASKTCMSSVDNLGPVKLRSALASLLLLIWCVLMLDLVVIL